MPTDLHDLAKRVVLKIVTERLEKSDPPIKLDLSDIFVSWFSETLGNWKALVSTTLLDGRYYEVTHNGFQFETYVDTYVKVDNTVFNGQDMDSLF